MPKNIQATQKRNMRIIGLGKRTSKKVDAAAFKGIKVGKPAIGTHVKPGCGKSYASNSLLSKVLSKGGQTRGKRIFFKGSGNQLDLDQNAKCPNCGHEFITRSQRPKCKKCKHTGSQESFQIIS